MVVKVQYPTAERFFKMDRETMRLLISLDGTYGDAIGGVIDRLEQKGYVSRNVSPQDRRRRAVCSCVCRGGARGGGA